MVKIKESAYDPIRPDRYYIWTWHPKASSKYKTKKSLYKKHITTIPFYTRKHIRITMKYYFKDKVARSIHIISGRKLIKMGITQPGPWCEFFYYKGYPIKARKFFIPDNYKMTSHSRRKFLVSMYLAFTKHGKKYFNEKYQTMLYGQRRGIDTLYIREKRLELYKSFIPKIKEDLRQRNLRVELLPRKYGFRDKPKDKANSPLPEEEV